MRGERGIGQIDRLGINMTKIDDERGDFVLVYKG